jgi:ESX secretion system protein EccE
LVVAELIALTVVLAALSRSPLGWLVGTPVAGALTVLGFGRWRRRWLHAWLGTALRYAGRTRALPAGTGADALLALVEPGARVTSVDTQGVIESEYGIAAVIELGDPTDLLTDAPLVLPSPVPLLPPGDPDSPAVQVQLIVSGSPAPGPRAGSGIPATSYRQLIEGRGVADQRALLAVRVVRDGTWPDAELHRALTGALRRARRRLSQDGIPYRILGAEPIVATVAELAHHRPGTGFREGWASTQLGGLRQACLRVDRLPALRAELAGQLVSRLVGLPATATTVSVAVSAHGAEVLVRLAAPNPAALVTAVQAARRLLGSVGLRVTRLDGHQAIGLAATLPLGLVGTPGAAGPLADSGVELRPAGMALGRNRRGEPVSVRLLRPEPTRAVLVGGTRAAQLVTLRALALGAHVAVRTGQPEAWGPYLRAVSLPSDAVALVPPGQPLRLPPADRFAPQLVVLEAGPAPAEEGPWRTTLVVRDALGEADLEPLARADLVIVQPLSAAEAALVGTALGLGDGQEWLARIGSDMVGVVNRRTVRFARLAATPLELQLIGTPERVAAP